MVVRNALRGVAIGAANTVPGVSGGTIAVVTGIYDRLVEALGGIVSRRWREHLLFLVPVLVGIVAGIAAFAWVIDWGLANAPEQTFFFFIGLILGSVRFVWLQLEPIRPRPLNLLICAVAFGLLVVQAVVERPPLGEAIATVEPATVLPLLGAGAVATATMIIPGISGSFVLVIIGMYSTFLQAVRTGNAPVLGVLLVGAIVGLVAASRSMSFLLHRFREPTYWTILGLVAGSIIAIWPGVTSVSAALLDLLAVAVGLALALLLGTRRSAAAATEAEEAGDDDEAN